MTTEQRQIAFKIDARQYELFASFTRRLELSPYGMMKIWVETWAGAEELMQRIQSGSTNQPEAFAELGRLVERFKTVMRLNGVLEEAIELVYAHYGVKQDSVVKGDAHE
jgi:hypothetical protein